MFAKPQCLFILEIKAFPDTGNGDISVNVQLMQINAQSQRVASNKANSNRL